MCWRSNDTVIKKVAERDFYVYKIVPLVPYNLCVNSYIIDRGYHSYKWIALEDTYPNERCLCLGNYNSALKENISLYKGCCIATFIVPEGAEYFENKYGHIVSSEIIYTGKYLRISNFSK